LLTSIQAISIVPLQVHYYSELPTQNGDCVGVSRLSATGNCEWKTCPSFLRAVQSGIRTRIPLDERRRIYQWVTMPHNACIMFFFSLFFYPRPVAAGPIAMPLHFLSLHKCNVVSFLSHLAVMLYHSWLCLILPCLTCPWITSSWCYGLPYRHLPVSIASVILMLSGHFAVRTPSSCWRLQQ